MPQRPWSEAAVDPEVEPVKQPLRPIAFHYQDAVEKELEKQVADDILERVDSRTKPPILSSSLVIIPKYRKASASNGEASNLITREREQQYELAVKLPVDSLRIDRARKRTSLVMFFLLK